MCEEANDCAETLEWDQDTLPHFLTLYETNDIFNANETACNYKAVLARLYAFIGEAVTGIKTPKDQLKVRLCANMTETEKLQPMVIGKVKQPTAMKK